MKVQSRIVGIDARGWLCMWIAVLMGGFCQVSWAEEDLYELASEAADAEIEKAEEVLKEEEKKYGKEWLTPERLIGMMIGWSVLLVLVLVLVVRDLRKRRRRWVVVVGWVVAVVMMGFFAGLVYWVIQKLTVNKSLVL